MAKLLLEIVTPDRLVLKEEVDELTAPGAFGQFGVLPGHTTLLTQLSEGPLTYVQAGRAKSIQVRGGFAEVRKDHVTILADAVETPTVN
jgi:F-type H+-transporting ATPase subunit epsilon